MRIKLCGIRTLANAQFAALQGAWALGFNFYPKSRRYIAPLAAKEIISKLTIPLLKVGIFVGASDETLGRYQEELNLDLLQVYAPLSKIPSSLKAKMIFCVQEEAIPKASILDSYAFVLLDAARQKDGLIGGTGRVANWSLAASLARDHRLILAGGLQITNLREAFDLVKPYALDLASGIENAGGVITPTKIRGVLQESKYEE